MNARKQKGTRGEAEIASLIDPLVRRYQGSGKPVQRRLGQARDSGGDIHTLGLIIEVKRQETLSIDRWWAQVERAADQFDGIPVLAYRQNRKQWQFCLPAYLLELKLKHGYVTIGRELFLEWLELYLGDMTGELGN